MIALPKIPDQAVASAMRNLEEEILDLRRIIAIADYLISNEGDTMRGDDGEPVAIRYTVGFQELISFAMIDAVRRSNRLEKRFQKAYAGEATDG
jgi:hypothetical protein